MYSFWEPAGKLAAVNHQDIFPFSNSDLLEEAHAAARRPGLQIFIDVAQGATAAAGIEKVRFRRLPESAATSLGRNSVSIRTQ